MSLATITSGAQLADVTVAQLFAARLAEWPSKTAYHQKRYGAWTAVTWDTYAQRVVNLASALQRAGLQRGDRVAIMGDSSQEWLIADMAIM
jgi:long-chain acyl-CoA synthetase